ncbi:hypothetical protein DNTS_003297 [Danionella cerebrum]|uniref:Lipocalin/cytosolic fatty-acid binding domain-containing protein n=1 Tax=Danionella cerebrum TaxID=2873325 RepID=A0A553MVL7_9TELE|nr:hypothetical protein DNTS_003297 [Danionella translucida]
MTVILIERALYKSSCSETCFQTPSLSLPVFTLILQTAVAMVTRLQGILGVLFFALAVSAEVLPPPDFDINGLAGKWYLIGFATNAEWFLSRKASMKMGIATVTPTEDGDLDMAYSSLNSDGSCWRMSYVAQKTETPGKFSFYTERSATDNDMRIVDVKYDEFALIHTIKTKDETTTVLNKLYGKSSHFYSDEHRFVMDSHDWRNAAWSEESRFLPHEQHGSMVQAGGCGVMVWGSISTNCDHHSLTEYFSIISIPL